jgi:hypothetical protein
MSAPQQSCRLTAMEARDLMNIKKESFERTLSAIRQMCDINIKDASRRGQHFLSFDVPATVWGRDGYDHQTMGRTLAEQLFEDGFDITGTTVKLMISWGPSKSKTPDPPQPKYRRGKRSERTINIAV